MAAMGAENKVVDIQAVGLPDCRAFLAQGEVGRSGVVVLDALVFAFELDLVDDRLKRPQHHHVMKDGDELVLAVQFLLFRQGLAVRADRNRRKVNLSLLEQFLGINFQLLRHEKTPLTCNACYL